MIVLARKTGPLTPKFIAAWDAGDTWYGIQLDNYTGGIETYMNGFWSSGHQRLLGAGVRASVRGWTMHAEAAALANNHGVSRGECVAIAGPSGSGKTTLLNLVGCLDVPTTGEVYIQDHPVSRLNDKQGTSLRRDALGFIFQSFNLVPLLAVFENVEFPLIVKGRPQSERAVKVRDILSAVGLSGHQEHKPNQLSGGQRQRVAVARALVTDPLIVLADEPTANLHSETGSAIIRLMQRINTERNVTFIFSTHDVAIMNLATRRVVLRDGTVGSDGSAVETKHGKESIANAP